MEHSDLSETTWKRRFIVRLARHFLAQGLDEKAAVADAAAHADDRYACRNGVPEDDADVVFASLLAEMPEQNPDQPDSTSKHQQMDR